MEASYFRKRILLGTLLFSYGAYLIIAIHSVMESGPVWDDEIEYIGLLDQISYGKNILTNGFHANLDYESAIATNLEFYGIVNKIFGLILFRLVESLLGFLIPWTYADEFLGTVFFNKLITVCLFSATLYVVFLTAKRLELRHPIVPSLLLLGLPTFVGHSWLNIKDIPFAFVYTLLTLSLICRLQLLTGRDPVIPAKSNAQVQVQLISSRIFVVVSAALTVACRPAFIPIAFITVCTCNIFELYLIKSGCRDQLFKRCLMDCISLTALSSALIPASWLHPFSYFLKTVSIHSRHPWGGCMFINQRCQGVGSAYTTLDYIRDWLLIKLPLLHQGVIILSIVAAIGLIYFRLIATNSFDSHRRFIASPTMYPVLVHTLIAFQAFGILFIAIVNNSNTYDGLRHWLFCFPALFLICYSLIERFYDGLAYLRVNSIGIVETVIVSVLCVGVWLSMIDAATMSPYSYAYLNEQSRVSNDHTSVDLDYWGSSSKEIASKIYKRGWSISNIMDNGSSEHVIFPKLFLKTKEFPSKDDVPQVAVVHKRSQSQAFRLSNKTCDDRFSIMRKLMFGRELNIATVGLNCRD